MFQQKTDGWLYYAVNAWPRDATPIDPAAGAFVDYTPATPNSQGELLYPGLDGPIGSLRLAAIRDGIEDYEYLAALSQTAGVEAAREICRSVSWGILQWTHDPSILMEARAKIARLICAPRSATPP